MLDSGLPLWLRMSVGGAFGLLIGLAFGGGRPERAADFCFDPKSTGAKGDDRGGQHEKTAARERLG
jgi:hypothetical protein